MNTESSFENVVGDSFEDMSVYDMTLVQGTGDVNVESTPALVSEAVIYGTGTGAGTVAITRAIKG